MKRSSTKWKLVLFVSKDKIGGDDDVRFSRRIKSIAKGANVKETQSIEGEELSVVDVTAMRS